MPMKMRRADHPRQDAGLQYFRRKRCNRSVVCLAYGKKSSDGRPYPGIPAILKGRGGNGPREGQAQEPGPEDVPEGYKFLFLMCMGLLFILLAFLFNTPKEIWSGSIVILTSPANLLTDYFQLANIGATLVNVGLMTLLSAGVIRWRGVAISGSVIAAVFTVAGFSFFGKNLYNTLPIMLGVYGYSKAVRQPFGKYILHAMFATALSPLVSEFSFNLALPPYIGIALGIITGMVVGFIIAPLSMHFLKFHQGLSLYNIGFTAGIIGMLFMAVLRGFGVVINTVSLLSSGHNPAFSRLLYSLFAVLFLCGLGANRWKVTGFGPLLRQEGVLGTDFTAVCGLGVTVMNMALLGILSTTYVLVLGGELNGPVIGGIFTVVGFGAYGKHIRNVVPVLAGVFLVNLCNVHVINSSFALMGALFGTTLAPVAGRYGAVAGIFAGMLHMSLVTNIGFLHAGMNLYNNGFSGGFIAAALCPLLDALLEIKKVRKREDSHPLPPLT